MGSLLTHRPAPETPWQPSPWEDAVVRAIRGYVAYGIKRRVYGVPHRAGWTWKSETI